ncbi:MAG: tripartite tricarboxylate transporter TctB family protein [Clostridia bacterium]|nr:tripartite tricarboxylate transporter TctB family protein [Clostridia bacterium]
MKKLFNLKIFVSIALLAIGGYWLHLANQLGTGKTGDQSTWGTTATLPRFILILFLICNAVVLILDIRKALMTGDKEEKRDPLDAKSLKISILMMAIIFAYSWLIDIFGYIISNIVLVFIALWMFGERNWIRLIALPVGVTVVLYLVFRYVLLVSLPGISFL